MTEFASFLLPSNEVTFNQKTIFLTKSLNFNEPETPTNIFDKFKRECDDTMRIYLRLRPSTDNDLFKCFETLGDHNVLAIPPQESASYRNFMHGYGKTSQKFTFSKIFSSGTTQDTIFDESTKPLLDDFVKGNDRLMFTYGTTSSGKTYTMNGTKKNVGVIPRSLITLFKSAHLSNDAAIMPIDFSEVSLLKNVDVQRILRDKATLLKLSEKESSDIMNTLNVDSTDNGKTTEVVTTFWVTFMEIYNELIYDLLDVAQCAASGINKVYKRPILDIRTARNGGSYVKGLSCYPVYSAEEAYRILLVGRRNQRMGATLLNDNSSRSHTIFTIRAVHVSPASHYLTRVINLSFCDLAGSERTVKAGTTGISQKEANNINSSLLALGRCIEVLRSNQSNPGNMSIVPFRDSKLTRLFQTYLTGNGTAAMIVCVNPDRRLFDESVQVLKFSALVRSIVFHDKEKNEDWLLRKSHFHRLGLMTPGESSHAWDSDDAATIEGDYDTDDGDIEREELIETIELLKMELVATKKEKIASEARLTDRLNNDWSRTILQMESDHSKRMQEMRDEMNTLIRKSVKTERRNVYAQMKKRKLQGEFSDEEDKLAAKDREIVELKSKIKEYQEESVEANETADILAQELAKLRLFSQQQSFRIATLDVELNVLRSGQTDRHQESAAAVIVAGNRDSGVRSNVSRTNRFSSLTCDPSVKKSACSQSVARSQGYFGPLRSPTELQGSLTEVAKITKKVHMFEIHEEDIEDDASFLRNEELARNAVLGERVECGHANVGRLAAGGDIRGAVDSGMTKGGDENADPLCVGPVFGADCHNDT